MSLQIPNAGMPFQSNGVNLPSARIQFQAPKRPSMQNKQMQIPYTMSLQMPNSPIQLARSQMQVKCNDM